MKLKRSIFFLLLLVMLSVVLSCGMRVSPESDFEVVYGNGGRNVEIVRYTGRSQVVVIPPRIQRRPVVTIRATAFCGIVNPPKLHRVEIPKTVKTIEIYAFCCNQLTSITIPRGVEFTSSANDWYYSDDTVGWREFRTAYNENNRRAGIYTRSNTNSREWRRSRR